MKFNDIDFAESLVRDIASHQDFEMQTRWFDGSIMLECAQNRLWMKIYRGRVIEHLPFMPPLGYTFKITGSPEAWEMLRAGTRRFADLLTPGVRHFKDDPGLTRLGQMTSELQMEGNMMEASRMTAAVYIIGEVIANMRRNASNAGNRSTTV